MTSDRVRIMHPTKFLKFANLKNFNPKNQKTGQIIICPALFHSS
ncbi:hypothetical protein [Moraxella bovis]|nr:hypothetical protein [Moraxella bovis]